ncbi:MAG: 2-oxoglutarate dehydrogenase complex dihydrolipoyllysine-residue succinyltransferase [Pseudomonadota bacterium]
MSTEIKVPALPESVSDATIMDWYKKPGDTVRRDENLVDLETDKVVLEVPAPADGVLKEIHVQSGATVHGGDVIAVLEEGAVAEQKSTSAAPASPAPEKSEQAPAKKEEQPASATVEKSTASAHSDIRATSNKLSPSLRRLAAEQGLSTEEIAAQQTNLNVAQTMQAREEKRVPMTRLRQRVAERLLNVKQSTAMLTTFNEVDMSAVMSLRQQYKDTFEKKHGTRLGFMSFFTKAVVEALKRFPAINASIDDNDIVYHNYFDIGIAVSTDRGLVVPVVRDADKMTMAGIELQIRDFGARGRDGKLTLDDLSGGNFTITNGGVFGSMLSTPILNPPQSAILGMHNIVERPVVRDGEIVIRPIMYLALSYDHRIVDGKDSVSFLVTVKELLEDPAKFLLDL